MPERATAQNAVSCDRLQLGDGHGSKRRWKDEAVNGGSPLASAVFTSGHTPRVADLTVRSLVRSASGCCNPVPLVLHPTSEYCTCNVLYFNENERVVWHAVAISLGG